VPATGSPVWDSRETKITLVRSVQQVMRPPYTSAAKRVGAAMRLAYRHKRPADRAAEEVELAMLHGGYGLDHSRLQGRPRGACRAGAPAAEEARQGQAEACTAAPPCADQEEGTS
jgi:hypothetical protein